MNCILQPHIVFNIINHLEINDIVNFLQALKKDYEFYKIIITSIFFQLKNKYESLDIIQKTFTNIENINNCAKYMEYKEQIYNKIFYDFKPYFLNDFCEELVKLYVTKLEGKQKIKFTNLFQVVLKKNIEFPNNAKLYLSTNNMNVNKKLFIKICSEFINF